MTTDDEIEFRMRLAKRGLSEWYNNYEKYGDWPLIIQCGLILAIAMIGIIKLLSI